MLRMPENLTEDALGRRIRTARLDSGLTQLELAEAIGSDQPRVSRLEAGKDVSSVVLTQIARATGKDVDFFLRPIAIAEAEYLMRDGDATEPGLVRAIDQMGKLIADYEFLARLQHR